MDGWDAVILAGGAARRMGGVDKPGLRVGGRTMLERVVDAVRGATVVVVGPPRPHPPARYPRIPGSGRCRVAHRAREVVSLVCAVAADMPFLNSTAVATLRTAAAPLPGPCSSTRKGSPSDWQACGAPRGAAASLTMRAFLRGRSPSPGRCRSNWARDVTLTLPAPPRLAAAELIRI